MGTFPAQQRPPGDPAQIKKGSGLYGVHCRACHGPDLRGGDMGGPNLLRSQLVLNDQDGELIVPVVQNGRMNPGMPVMPPLPIPEADIKAVAAYIHSVTATCAARARRRPATPSSSTSSSATRRPARRTSRRSARSAIAEKDMQGIATRVADPVELQNFWVVGGGGRGGRARRTVDPGVR